MSRKGVLLFAVLFLFGVLIFIFGPVAICAYKHHSFAKNVKIQISVPSWGTWRARLEKVSVQDNRTNTFYLHNSHKGYTHGCAETCDELYDRFVKLHDQGVGYIYVDVRYAGNSTNGGTKQ